MSCDSLNWQCRALVRAQCMHASAARVKGSCACTIERRHVLFFFLSMRCAQSGSGLAVPGWPRPDSVRGADDSRGNARTEQCSRLAERRWTVPTVWLSLRTTCLFPLSFCRPTTVGASAPASVLCTSAHIRASIMSPRGIHVSTEHFVRFLYAPLIYPA